MAGGLPGNSTLTRNAIVKLRQEALTHVRAIQAINHTLDPIQREAIAFHLAMIQGTLHAMAMLDEDATLIAPTADGTPACESPEVLVRQLDEVLAQSRPEQGDAEPAASDDTPPPNETAPEELAPLPAVQRVGGRPPPGLSSVDLELMLNMSDDR